MTQDSFFLKAKDWDTPYRIELIAKFVKTLESKIHLDSSMNAMEIGCGTGLVGLQLAKQVKRISMVDNSPAMINSLKEKTRALELSNVKIITGDAHSVEIQNMDIVVLFMALHHFENIDEFFAKVSSGLNKNGLLIIGDLITEDGSFHGGEDMPHNGFDTYELMQKLSLYGFSVIENDIYDNILKNGKDYPLFIMMAQKE
jgi:ubiquinone/menaquinone biosynthesis C-methylase UbiE